MKENLNIPKTIKVGFQKREDTYTGQLAFVVYTDVKGVLRKETSWNGWRDKKIAPKDFDNVPTSGFVLNKGVGGARESCGWNPRNEWIRVYDPRGFEFEISVANLLFILQECTSTKGKGIEGEFVYAWDKADLVLLPCDSVNYKKAEDFTKRIVMSVPKKDVVPGGTYLTKDGERVMFLGYHRVFDHSRGEYSPTHNKDFNVFVFLDERKAKDPRRYSMSDGLDKYLLSRDFKKISEVIDKNSDSSYADELGKFMASEFSSKLARLTTRNIKDEHSFWAKIVAWDGEIYFAETINKGGSSWINRDKTLYLTATKRYTIKDGFLFMEEVKKELKKLGNDEKLDCCVDIFGVCENGKKVKLT